MICDKFSTPSEKDGISVVAGTLSFSGIPSQAVRKTTVVFTVNAHDTDTGASVVATVSLNGIVVSEWIWQ
jgi:hypothetical protein